MGRFGGRTNRDGGSGAARLVCQASATAVNAAHADITAFTVALATRVENRATHVAEADTRYIANETGSTTELAGVIR
jgi:hypothetical protein